MTLKIRHKLFFAILTANIILAASIFILSNWSFSHSFKQYLDSTQAEKLSPLVADVASVYKKEKSWNWVKSRNNTIWPRLIHKHVLKRPPPPAGFPPPHFRPPGSPEPPRGQHTFGPPPHKPTQFGSAQFNPPPLSEHRPPPRPPPSQPLEIDRAILLADADKNLILGPPKRKQQAYWLPVNVDNTTVGYIGFFRTTELTSELDQLFMKRLQTSFGWIMLGMILVSAIIALPLARRLVNPVEKLQAATHKIASGKFDTRVENNNNDELGELSRDFNHLSETLSKNLLARQQWIADISHELRTPVAVLQGELEAIQDGIRELSPAAVISLHQEIVRLSRLINDLHQLSLSDMGALSYKKESLNITDIIEDVIDSSQALITKNNITVTFSNGSEKRILVGDYHRLTQLFFNLLNNSLSYTNENGKILVTVSSTSKHILINWCDSKPGITDDQLNKIFDRLYRVDKSRNRNTGGSGLGLAICKNIIDAHQGSVTVKHSRLGGICFHLTFPRQWQLSPD